MKIKKVVIAAAGQGTRMRNLSKDKPKHLIEVNKRPFLAYVLDNLFLAGYTDIILVGGYMNELMEDFKNNYIPPEGGKINIKFINQYEILGPKEKIYGTACPLMCVKDDIKEQFLFIGGDNLFSVKDLKAMNIDDDFNYVAGLINENPENYGVLVTNGEYLEKIVEKPKEYIGNLINAGLYKFTPEVFNKLPLITKSPRGEYEITDVISLLAEEKKVKVKKIQDYWKDFGKPEDIEKLAQFLKKSANHGSSKNKK
jgi:UDP-N-acetylglucosamine diphosphorylase / glucose-1-phosphate thymidylyltransferase / UDP-N-acetylgalactosamine diphosphorylase / glucosamine-1-phosphate N-acetyltransferase / galactosamine-1-phosphate N-acetyltransferase